MSLFKKAVIAALPRRMAVMAGMTRTMLTDDELEAALKRRGFKHIDVRNKTVFAERNNEIFDVQKGLINQEHTLSDWIRSLDA